MAEDKVEIGMNASDLYREEVVSDRRSGSIRIMTPLTAEGEVDSTREVLFVGQAQLMTPVGSLPLSFDIKAKSLKEAVAGFGPAAEIAVQQAVEELRELQREQASSLVVPGAGDVGGGMGGGPGAGGLLGPGGGKLKF